MFQCVILGEPTAIWHSLTRGDILSRRCKEHVVRQLIDAKTISERYAHFNCIASPLMNDTKARCKSYGFRSLSIVGKKDILDCVRGPRRKRYGMCICSHERYALLFCRNASVWQHVAKLVLYRLVARSLRQPAHCSPHRCTYA